MECCLSVSLPQTCLRSCSPDGALPDLTQSWLTIQACTSYTSREPYHGVRSVECVLLTFVQYNGTGACAFTSYDRLIHQPACR